MPITSHVFASPSSQSVQVETEMTTVERVVEYYSLSQEPPAQVPPKQRPPVDWTSHGEIAFDHVVVFCTDTERWKRLLSLEFFFEWGCIIHGYIMIDQINIEPIGLDDLRTRLSIISQDPVLLTGSMRSDLDPFNHYTGVRSSWRIAFESAVALLLSGSTDRHSRKRTSLNLGQYATNEELETKISRWSFYSWD
jgi:hypothetical protein